MHSQAKLRMGGKTMLARTSSLMVAVLTGWLLTAGAAPAAVAEVRDEAEFFKKDTVQRADRIIQEIKDRYKHDLLIETFDKPPSGIEADLKKADDDSRERE